MSLTIDIKENVVEDLQSPLRYTFSETRQAINSTKDNWLQVNAHSYTNSHSQIIQLSDKQQQDHVIATVSVTPAELSEFQAVLNIDRHDLENTISIDALWIDGNNEQDDIIAASLYLALRRARIMGKTDIITLLPSTEHPLVSLLGLEVLDGTTTTIDGKQYIAMAQRLAYAIYRVYQHVQGNLINTIKPAFKAEIIETTEKWLEHFFQGKWATAINNQTMSKQQYIHSLFNLHQYVRQTTQHLGRCVALAPNTELRSHFIEHLKGEVNHELIIENDLRHLGADVDYIKHFHVPHIATKEFMVVQESTIAFYQDTILMLACPLAAEGVSSHLTPEFLNNLYTTIASWGVEKPKRAAQFLTSHVNTDGGEDGHWLGVVKMIEEYINNEADLQRFLSVQYAAQLGFERGFNAIIEEMSLWATKA